MRVYARGKNGTREGFYMKTSPVTPSFYWFNTRNNQRLGSAGLNTFEWRDFQELSLGTEIGLPSRCVVIVILRPELLYYLMSMQVSLEKVDFFLKIKEIS